jgi:sporulation protein YlmC with PRC-barrel domain
MDDKAAKADSAPMKDAKFIPTQGMDQFAWSKFKGTDVLGPDNAKIGDVDDILFEKDGKVVAFIVGVGGFLGVGQKNVAIDLSAFQFVPADSVKTTSRDSGTTGTTAPSPARTSTDPHDVKLKVSWTKDQLKNAASFEYFKAVRSEAPATSPRPAGSSGSTTR